MNGNSTLKNSKKSTLMGISNGLGLSLRARFFLPSFIGIVLALILNLSYQSILASNQETFRQLKNNNLPQISHISRISVSLVNNQNKLSQILLSTIKDPDEERVYTEGKEVYQNLYAIESAIKEKLSTISQEEKRSVFRINRVFIRYKHSVENALEISTVDSKLAIEELIKSSHTSQQLNDLFIELSDHYAESLTVADNLLNESLKGKTKINIISIILIIMMIILPIVFFKRLTENLEQINRGLIKLNKGKKFIALPSSNDPYINSLTAAVMTFQKTLSDINSAREKAEISNHEKSKFLTLISHEIRTPMNGVLGMLARIEKNNNNPEQNRHIEMAQSSANSLRKIINDILDFSKIDAGKISISPINFDLTELVNEITTLYTFKIENKGLEFTTDINLGKHCYCNADPVRIKQILDNLLCNAVKFTKQGKITLRINIQQESHGISNIEFVVKDSGCGISKHQQSNLFEPYMQADDSATREHGGTGLGLSIVRRLCHLMKGDIFVSSTIDKGSKFTVSLPLKMIETPIVVDQDTADDELIFSKPTFHEVVSNHKPEKRVLIVEDNPINIEVLSFLLEDLDLNLSITITHDGRQALDALNSSSATTPYVLVLMDCQMPIMDGYEATQKIRSGEAGHSYSNIPIIAITANAMKDDKEKCLLIGMNDFISKPIDIYELKIALNKYL